MREAASALPAEPKPANTLTSTEALAAALAFTPELALQRAHLDVARADVMRAREHRNPILNLSPEHLIGTAAAGVSPWVVALGLVWPLHTAGKRARDIEQSLAMSDAALLNGAGAIWTLRLSVRNAVCSLELASARNALGHQESDLRADLAGRLLKQADAGIASRYDAARANLDRDQAVQRARQLDAELHAARFDLAELTGLTAQEIERRKVGESCLTTLPSAVDPVEALEERAIAGRLDLRAKLAEFRAADAAYRLELARRFPDIDLGTGYVYDQGDRRITFSIAGELPIFSHNDAAIARATAERNRTIAEVNKLQWGVRSAVDRSRDQLELTRQQYADAQRIATDSQALLERDRARFESGEVDQPAVITTRIIGVTAQLDALATRKTLLDAIAALETATQTPLVPPFFGEAAATSLLAPPEPPGTH